MSETHLLIRERKKKRTKYPLLEPKEEETNEEYSTQDEQPERRIRARGVYYEIEDAIKKANDQAKLQENLLKLRQREMEERLFTARNALTNSELGNVAKVVLSDQTITLGKGKQTSRQHRKVAWGFWHKDTEETTEITLQRGGAEDQ